MPAAEHSSAHDVVSKFENANDANSFKGAFNSAVLLTETDRSSWQDVQSQLQSADLSKIGLNGFEITGIDAPQSNNNGAALSPELELTATDGSGKTERVDSNGKIYDSQNNPTGDTLQFANSTPSDSTSTTAATTSGDSTSATTNGTTPSDNAAAPIGNNGRTVQMNSDDTSGTYSVQGGDTLWSIAQDVLTPPGQTLTPDQIQAMAPQIEQEVQKIAQDNNINDPNLIQPGEQLTLNGLKPGSGATAGGAGGGSGDSGTPTVGASTDGTTTTPAANTDGTNSGSQDTSGTPDAPAATPGDNSQSSATQPTTYTPLMPEGLSSTTFDGGGQLTLSDQSTLYSASGTLPDGTDSPGASFLATENVDANGNLLGSTFTFPGGVDMTFSDGQRNQQVVSGVESITNKAQADGTYQSIITNAAGATFVSTLDINGQVESFQQLPDAAAPATTPGS
jgi:hypothetical protein